jgi:hypothetical protein
MVILNNGVLDIISNAYHERDVQRYSPYIELSLSSARMRTSFGKMQDMVAQGMFDATSTNQQCCLARGSVKSSKSNP